MDQLDEALARSRRDDLVAATRRLRRTPAAHLRRSRAVRTPRPEER
jgi:hypothetical protein